MDKNVTNMFWAGRKPVWDGIGTKVDKAMDSREALVAAGLDWEVLQEPVFTENDQLIKGYKANIRSSDNKVLGIVSERYRIVQNVEAFSFTDSLLREGVRYETAGSFLGGRKIWILAKLPLDFMIVGDRISPYVVFVNSFDGSGAIRCCLTSVRVSCQNNLGLALKTAQRSWSMNHVGAIEEKLDEARNTLFMADSYMENLGREFEMLRKKKSLTEM